VGNSSELCETCSFGNYTSVVGSETCNTCDAGYYTTQITQTLTCGAQPDQRVQAHCASTCTPSSGATSGIISDGDGTYLQSIVLEEEFDYVLVFQCYDALCLNYTELLRYTGTLSDTSTVYSSTTGFLKVLFISDYSQLQDGFTATWSIGRGEQCCPVHSTAPPGASSPQECVCDAGFEDTDLGSETVCTACGPGTYKAFAGAGACSSCPEHLQPDASGSECVCNAGYFSQRTCQDNMSWWDSEGSSCMLYMHRNMCAEGTYGPGWIWDQWTFASWAVDGIDASHACCECGSKWNAPSVCVACWQNSYKETVGNSSELCQTCVFGNYTSVVGSETCRNCDAGYHTTEQITPTLTCGDQPDQRVQAHCASTCTPSSGATSGIISDGDGTYPDFQACWWLLSASPGVEISISFQSIVLEKGFDFVLIFQCYDALCLNYTELLRYTGTLSDTSTVYSSTTGFLKMVFYSDYYPTTRWRSRRALRRDVSCHFLSGMVA
jgi:hypothetical protein